MPSHKVLNSVVRSLVESFTSLMNYSGDDYVMGHAVQAAWQSGDTNITANLLTGSISQSRLLVEPVIDSINQYIKGFPSLVERSGSSMEFIKQAELILTIDPSIRRPIDNGSPLYESPFTCSAILIDERGKVYKYGVSAWWYPEHPPLNEGKLSILTMRFLRLIKRDT